MLAGSFSAVNAAELEQEANHINYGRTGLFIPGGLDRNFVHAHRISSTEAPWAPVRFIRPLILFEVHPGALSQGATQGESQPSQTQPGQNVSGAIPTFLTYVFFNIGERERRVWENGDLNIYYWDETSGGWRTCNASLVENETTSDLEQQENTRGSMGGRLACVAPQLTYYGLGVPRGVQTGIEISQ